jgi:peroxin-6
LLATVLQECIDNVNQAHATTGYPVMVIATTGDIETLPSSVLSCFRHEVAIGAPDEKARLQIITNLLHDSPLAPDVALDNLATQTAALVAKDLVDLTARAGVLSLQRIDRSMYVQYIEMCVFKNTYFFFFFFFFFFCKRVGGVVKSENKLVKVSTQDIQAAGITLTAADFESALGEARASYSDSIGAPKVDSV